MKTAKPSATQPSTTKRRSESAGEKPKVKRAPRPQGKRHKAGEEIPSIAQGVSVQAIAAQRKVSRLKALIEPKTEAMVKVMIDIAEDDKVHASIRLEAASRVLDRAYGKPKEHLEVTETVEPGAEVDEMTTLLNNILAKVGANVALSAPEGVEIVDPKAA